MDYPKITLITPSFNQGKFIEQTINSVLAQQYPNLEYMVIDGGSTDNSAGIISKYEKHLAYWISEKDKGQPDAINKGLQRATGQIFNWLNSDDYLESDSLKSVAEKFLENESTNIVCGNYRIFDEENNFEEISTGTRVQESYVKTLAFCGIHQPCTFFKMSVIREFGGINPKLHFCLDYEFWLKYLLKYKKAGIAPLEKTLCSMRLHPESKTSLHMENLFKSKTSLFKIEKNSIFKSIALHYKLNDFIEVINLLSNKFVDEYNFKFDFVKSDMDEKTVRGFLSYYIFRHAELAYEEGDFNFVNKIVKPVNIELLDKESANICKKLIKKSKFPLLAKSLRRVKRGFS